MIDTAALDEARLEWSFEQQEREHGKCCSGATIIGGRWVAVILPLVNKDGTVSEHYRPFAKDTA